MTATDVVAWIALALSFTNMLATGVLWWNEHDRLKRQAERRLRKHH